MKKIFITVFMLVTLMNLYAWTILPDRVADHFGRHGHPNGWTGKTAFCLIMQGLYSFLFLLFYFFPFLILKIPIKWINIPNKEYWFRSGNRSVLQDKISSTMHELGIAQLVFFGFIGILTIQANSKVPVELEESDFMFIFYGFMIYIVWWLIRFYRVFRIPSR